MNLNATVFSRSAGRIGRRLTVIYLVGIFIPLLLSNGLVLRGLLKEARRQQEAFAESSLRAVVDAIHREFEPIERISEIVYADTNLRRFLAMPYPEFRDYFEVHGAYLTPALSRFVSVFQGVSRMSIYSSNEAIQVSEGYLGIDEYTRSSDWYRAVRADADGMCVLRHVDADPRTQMHPETYVSVLRVLEFEHRTGEEHILRIDVRPSVFIRHLSPQGISGRITVVDERAAVVAANDGVAEPNSRIVSANFGPGSLLDEWGVVGKVEVGTIGALWSFRWTIALVASGLIVAVSSVLVLLLSRSVTRRLEQLSDQMKRIEEEDFSTIEQTGEGDEVSRLIESFNRMAARIDRLINEGYKLELERSRLLAAQRAAALDALQSQVNPHYLYNVLESIRMKAKVRGEEETASVVQRVSRSLRRIASWSSDLVTIEEELGFADDFIDIQRYRFGDRIRFVHDVEPDARDVLIPKATIQALVENACVHGLLEKAAGGIVKIDVSLCDGEVKISVEDNGAGCDQSPVVEMLRSADAGRCDHIGLPNVYQRLKLHYGENATLDFESRVGFGTRVVVRYRPDTEGSL